LPSLFGTARNEHYAGTKAALNALCRALAVELARYGVTANAILPGWIKSDMTAGIMANRKIRGELMPRILVRRFGEPADFGGIAVYLMSKASSYHTADCFVIDGGYTGVLRLPVIPGRCKASTTMRSCASENLEISVRFAPRMTPPRRSQP